MRTRRNANFIVEIVFIRTINSNCDNNFNGLIYFLVFGIRDLNVKKRNLCRIILEVNL